MGITAGAAAFQTVFAFTYLIERQHVRSPSKPVYEFFLIGIDARAWTSVGPDGALPDATDFAVWQFHALHGGGLEFGSTPAPAWPLVVVAVLGPFGAGALVAAGRGVDSPSAGAVRGSTVALGYLPLAVLTARTVKWDPPRSVRLFQNGVVGRQKENIPLRTWGDIHVQMPESVLLTGIAVPLVLGAVGGAVAVAAREGELSTAQLRHGSVYGAAAFVGGWLVTLLGTGGLRDRPLEVWDVPRVLSTRDAIELGESQVDPLTYATWQFHDLHGATIGPMFTHSVMERETGLVVNTEIALVVLALLVPALAGAALVRRYSVTEPRTAAATGALVVVGYLPLAAVTALDAALTPAGASLIVAPSFVDAVLLTGLAVPGLCGALGGVVATRVSVGVSALTGALPGL